MPRVKGRSRGPGPAKLSPTGCSATDIASSLDRPQDFESATGLRVTAGAAEDRLRFDLPVHGARIGHAACACS
jgi:hypothetical protein